MFSGLVRSLTTRVVRVTASRNVPQLTSTRLFARVTGDWRCACGFSNFASRSVCFQCHRAKPSHLCAVGEMPAVGAQQIGFKTGDWICTCGTHNFAKREHCLSCEAQKPACGNDKPTGTYRLLPGDWICKKCGMHNFRSRDECLRCNWKSSVPTASPSTSTSGSSVQQMPWTCTTCHTVNTEGNALCDVCGAPHLSPSSSSAARPDDWRCTQCDFLNFSSRAKCKNCRTVRASDSEVTDPSLWICDCGYKNFKDRESCRDCGSSRSSKV